MPNKRITEAKTSKDQASSERNALRSTATSKEKQELTRNRDRAHAIWLKAHIHKLENNNDAIEAAFQAAKSANANVRKAITENKNVIKRIDKVKTAIKKIEDLVEEAQNAF